MPPELEEEGKKLDQLSLAGETIEREIRRQTADGELRDFLFRTALLEREDRGIEGYGIYTDITDIKEYERMIERQNKRLEDFVDVVSHDLRNPLTVAQGYLGLELKESESQNLRRVRDALDRMENIVEDTLTLAREGKTVGETEVVDLKQAVERCWASVDTANADIVTEGDLSSIEGDGGRLSHLFENLFRNAVEHGGKDVTVRVGML
ncbi:MAG: HAMP domain-containing sensor histidine kinase, partial [Halobacteria archaeon]|nr:HAMP domain-containing sensor histidine kinase [Halobacteria archaeon]